MLSHRQTLAWYQQPLQFSMKAEESYQCKIVQYYKGCLWTLWSHFVDLFLGSRQTYFIMWSWVNVFPSICLYAFLIQIVIIRKLFPLNKFNFVFTFMMTTKLTIIFQYISKWRKYKTLHVIFYKNQWLSTNIYLLKICCKNVFVSSTTLYTSK